MPLEDSALHVNGLLTNISIGYKNATYIADQLFPIVPVRKRSDIIPKYDMSHWFRDQAHIRVSGTESRGGAFTVSMEPYYCHRYSYKVEIDDETRDNADDPFNPDRDGAAFVTDKIQLRREKAFTNDFFKPGVWANNEVGGVDFEQWDDFGGSAPLADITGWADTIEGLIGQEPKVLALGKLAWSQLKWHPDIIDTIKYTQRGVMNVDLFGSLVEIPKILIGRAIFTSTMEGIPEDQVVYERVWGKHALLLNAPDSPGLFTPAAGYTFVWNRVPNAIQYIKTFRIEPREVDVIEGNTYFDQRITSPNAGLFAQDVVG